MPSPPTPLVPRTPAQDPVPSPAAHLPPQLVGRVQQRHSIARRLTIFYVASLSAIAGLSITGQFLIQRALGQQTTDIQIIQSTLEQKENVGATIHALRELQQTSDTEDRQPAIQNLSNQIQTVKTSWQVLQTLSIASASRSGGRQSQVQVMVQQLRPSYKAVLAHLESALDREQHQSPQQLELRQSRRLNRVRFIQESLTGQSTPVPLTRTSTPPNVLPPGKPLQRLEEQYLHEIDQRLEDYNNSIAANVEQLKKLELILLAVTLVVLVLEGLLIFQPAVQQTHDSLAALALSLDQTQRTTAQLASEQKKSEKLLLNILPPSIAQRLKQKHQPIADAFDDVTVLFADIVGFTELSSQIPPQELVQLLNLIFSAFDTLVEAYGLEKIKTIGDAYMVVGGLPQPRADHAEAIAALALDMQAEVARFNEETGCSLNIRIGINSGPVVAGVIGIKKFIYDLWGDTVNLASRMESHGEPGQIQITQSTYGLICDRYDIQPRGTIQVKGKGETVTYWVIGHKGYQGYRAREAIAA